MRIHTYVNEISAQINPKLISCLSNSITNTMNKVQAPNIQVKVLTY